MRLFLMLILAGGAVATTVGCEARGEIDGDDDAELKVDVD